MRPSVATNGADGMVEDAEELWLRTRRDLTEDFKRKHRAAARQGKNVSRSVKRRHR